MKHHTIYKVFITLGLVILFGCEKPKSTEREYPTTSVEPYLDLELTDAERDSLQTDLEEYQKSYIALHARNITNDVPMSLVFDPLPLDYTFDQHQKPVNWDLPKDVQLPTNREELAFYPVYKLAVLIKNKKITSTELTRLYLNRLKKYGDKLQCVITITEAVAFAQAQRADDEIAKGKYRGPLHGIPYGIKDLLAVEGTKTTWGAEPFKEQVIDQTATVVRKLEDAGAVLVAKLTMGALAMGDIWYGGVTKNPWNLEQGSSGSSAGSAAATSAGLVAFSIGTETWGSIVSPATRCGVTGLRPSFGMVSRHGAMALCWSMDKIGPICRSALDCALVLSSMKGKDERDRSTREAAFNYQAQADVKKLKVGYLKSLFEADYPTKSNDQKVLAILDSLGIELHPVELPMNFPMDALAIILSAESAAAFDELTRSNRDSLLSNQKKGAWPNIFRAARFIPAVEYINATRIRQQLIEAYHKQTSDFDVIVAPSFGGNQLLMTNLTGHPCVVVPNGFNDKASPSSISFLGRLYGEAAVVSLARTYQEATNWDEKTPAGFN